MSSGRLDGWEGTSSAIAQQVRRQSDNCVAAYKVNSLLIEEHANIERATAQGGYGRRQLFELVQNAADAMLRQPNGKIHVLLTADYLYCANEGEPINSTGVGAILSSHLSVKRGTEIGRFGLGFKSVLGVTNAPHFFSRSGSFAFGEQITRQRLLAASINATRVPLLRIASPLDPAALASRDPVLAEFMSWAATVVRLPLLPGAHQQLAGDIETFPAEFLLFAPHVGRLTLENSTTKRVRQIGMSTENNVSLLTEGDQGSSWRIFATEHSPGERARADAGELADRPSLPLIWAVQLAGRSARGHLWAFFPTEYITTLSGIVNAPWKTNEDRQNLLKSTFNDELIEVAARLVVESLPELVDDADPGNVLDLLPGRGRESPNWADALLTERIYALASTSPCIPDRTGQLRRPTDLCLHPEGVPNDALALWATARNAPRDWCHRSIETRERRPRVERLMPQDRTATYAIWLETIGKDAGAEGSISALRVVGRVISGVDGASKPSFRDARIVLTKDERYVAPDPRLLFLGLTPDGSSIDLVHEDVESDAEALSALRALGVGPVDATSMLRAFLIRTRSRERDWSEFWKVARSVDAAALKQLVDDLDVRVHVRTVDGSFERAAGVLLPGPIVPADGTRDGTVAVDLEFHQNDTAALQALGINTAPQPGGGSTQESWHWQYRRDVLRAYEVEIARSGSRRPNIDYIESVGRPFAGPLEPLLELGEEGRRRFTEAVLRSERDFAPWTFAHRTQPRNYPELRFANPSVWLLQAYGVFDTSLGPRAAARLVSPALAEWSDFFPVPQLSEVATAISMPSALDALPEGVWQEAFDRCAEVRDASRLGAFYAAASGFATEVPDQISCQVGQGFRLTDRSSVHVATTQAETEALIEHTVPMVMTSREGADALRARWGLRPASAAIRTEIAATPLSDPTPLLDEFPALRHHLRPPARGLQLLRCSELRHERLSEHGKTSEETDFIIDGGTVYWRETGTAHLDLLRKINRSLELRLSDDDLRDIVRHRALQDQHTLLRRIRGAKDPIGGFLEAVSIDAIRRRLPGSLPADVRDGLSDRDAAELAHAIYGVDLLREFRLELQERGLNPPINWAGSRAARAFVRDLGFPVEYAGFEHESRDAVTRVDGPPRIPTLHDFQLTIKGNVRRLMRDRTNRRALLSLPTGAGKTRIAVEALVDALREGEITSPVLWIAQTDELCEQAVQAWTDMWRAYGGQLPLRLGRLWSGNEVDRHPGGPQVVVATVAKLSSGTVRDPEYGWLAESSCVVVDEAHGSTTPQYTEILAWLGLGRSREADRCPLVGLTATPFRGTSVDETQRLANRYNNRRLDQGVLAEDQYADLQEKGVLARVRHKLLEGTEITLTDDELDHLQRLRRLPSSVETKLGANDKRNTTILDSIAELPDDWTTLVFATSVDNAELLAALLTLRRIPAAVISAKTDPGARRHYIKAFRAGQLRVLTNYGVLAEGFDAPAVRAVFVTRPTYSPNVYQQMIGRGLRGPLNGGKDECLIVNLRDNVAQYGEALAFTQFEHLWAPM